MNAILLAPCLRALIVLLAKFAYKKHGPPHVQLRQREGSSRQNESPTEQESGAHSSRRQQSTTNDEDRRGGLPEFLLNFYPYKDHHEFTVNLNDPCFRIGVRILANDRQSRIVASSISLN